MSTTFHLVRHGLKERRIGDVSSLPKGLYKPKPQHFILPELSFPLLKSLPAHFNGPEKLQV